MARIESSVRETPAVRVIELAVVDAGGGLHAFRSESRLCDIGEDGGRSLVSETVRQGFVDEENLALLAKGLSFEQFQPYEAPEKVGHLHPLLATAEALEIIRCEGNPYQVGSRDRLVAEGHLFTPDKSNLVQAVAAGMTSANIVFFSSYDHAIVDLRGRPVPAAMRFDYMNGDITNELYDLDALAEVLSDNPEIEILGGGSGRMNRLVTSIPYYNASEDRDEQVQFIWRPTEESWSALLDAFGFDPSEPRHLRLKPEMLVRDVDFFGLARFRRDPADADDERGYAGGM